MCRRLVATHCLYGVDKNPLAVELAKLALWLESHAEGMPLTFLDHRLVIGDSLTGPFWERLLTRPGKPEEKLEGVLHRSLENNLRAALFDALKHVKRLETSVGATVAEMHEKEQAKRDLDKALIPFRVAAAAWAGGIMLGPENCDDSAYAELLTRISSTRELPKAIQSPALCDMIARGLGVQEVSGDCSELTTLIQSSEYVPALSYDLTFPEVFYPTGIVHGRQGFHAVLGNPPWDALQPLAKEFFATFDFDILAAPTRLEREEIEKRLLTDSAVKASFDSYVEQLDNYKQYVLLKYPSVNKSAGGKNSGAVTDLWQCFAEQSSNLLRRQGAVGIVLPSAFHANESATGIRELYLRRMDLRCCYSFENRRKLFEIHSSFKFATIVAEAGRSTDVVSCAFYLHDDEWLFAKQVTRDPLQYSLDFIERTGGDYLALLELQSAADLDVAKQCFSVGELFGQAADRAAIEIGQQAHMSKDAWRFTPIQEVMPRDADPRNPAIARQVAEKRYLPLHEGKTFWHYDDCWDVRPRYLVAIEQLSDKPSWVSLARYFRLAFRDIASSTNERTVVFCLLPPPCITGNTAPVERAADRRTNLSALKLLALVNTFIFDWTIRIRAASHVNFFILRGGVLPPKASFDVFIAHSAARLSCNHFGYQPLWHEQLGDVWREPGKDPFSWPALAGDDERWSIRAAIDAVVADAYGLSRDQYAHVLSTFSHASYPAAPALCLARFDELKQIGVAAFTQKYDPYHDILLNESLPQPVIDLPIPGQSSADRSDVAGGSYQLTNTAKPGRTPRRRRV